MNQRLNPPGAFQYRLPMLRPLTYFVWAVINGTLESEEFQETMDRLCSEASLKDPNDNVALTIDEWQALLD